MNHLLLPALLLSSILPLQAAEDLLNFKNSDTLHGNFGGFSGDGKMIWKNAQADQPITFATSEIRRVIFNKGLLTKPFTHSSSVTLVNGDLLPCEIIRIDGKSVDIRTDYAGNLEIPRKQIYSCEIYPHGQRVLYQGPFTEEEWEIVDFNQEKEVEKDDAEKEEEEKNHPWEHSNFSWFNDGRAGAITNKNLELPDSFRLTFKAEMARYSNVCVALHADFVVPEQKEEDDKKKGSRLDNVAKHFGSCVLVKLSSGSTYLSQYSFNEDGEVQIAKIPTTTGNSSARYSSEDYDQANIEIRADRIKGIVSTYADGSLIAQWNLSDFGYKAKGSGLGFVNMYNSSSRVSRISNIIITPWSGIRDSALSLQNEQRDILLLTNGTDRFSGDIIKMESDTVTLKGPYAEMEIPTDEIKSLNFATDKLAKAEEPSSGEVAFRFYGAGSLSGTPVSGDKESVEVNHPILGKLTLKYEHLSSIDYTADSAIIDRWNLKL